jgi:DNA mismatch endonuclease (patch repair protein)
MTEMTAVIYKMSKFLANSHLMGDVHTPKVRSYNMSQIKGKNTKPEILVRKYLFAKGLRYRIHAKLPGRPDIVFSKNRVAIFVHGCFWHRHAGCKYFVIPKTRTEWWLNKINGNCANDRKNLRALRKEGWKVVVVWECELKKGRFEDTLARLYSYLQTC